MSRRSDRKYAFQLIFQMEFHDYSEADECLELFFQEMIVSEDINKEFVESEFRGVIENKEKIDELINKYSEGWTVERLSKADLAIIRLCVYEMLFNEEIPHNVAINEAVELSKKYSSDESPSFVNGVLGKIVENI